MELSVLESINNKSLWGTEAKKININFAALSHDIEIVAASVVVDKGHFLSYEDLLTVYPSAPCGSNATVGSTLPWTLYVADINGNWVEIDTIGHVPVITKEQIDSLFV